MDYTKPSLNQGAIAPAISTGGFLDIAARCCLTTMFALAFWSLVLLTDLGSCTFVTFAFAGAFLLNLSLRNNKRWEIPAAIGVGSAYAAGYVAYGGPLASIPGSTLGIMGAFLGVGSLTVKSARGIWEADPAAIKSNRADLIEVGSIPLLCILSGVAVSLAATVIPTTYDPFLYAFDLSLGFRTSFVVGQFFRSHAAIAYAAALAYNYLPIGLIALRIVQLRHGDRGVDLRLIFATLGAVGFSLYAICPAVGPVHAFSGFPDNLPASVALARIPIGLMPRNAIPSLHVGWALLVFVNAWSGSWSRWVAVWAAIFLALTALATLGSGEHYLIDLVVAVPLTLAIQAGFKAVGSLRTAAVLTGAGLTAGWLIALRTGALVSAQISPALSCGLVLATLIVSLAMHVEVARRNSAY